jgi:signal peptidase I
MAQDHKGRTRTGNVLFGLAMAVALLVMAALGQSQLPAGTALVKPIQVSDSAMTPTLTRGMVVLAYHLAGDPRRGDLVVYRPRPGATMPGRVVGLPGDVVQTRSGKLSINGAPVDEPYVRDPIKYDVGPIAVDSGSYYVLGDNRNESTEDSHAAGAIPRDQILAGLQPIG